LTNLSKSSGGSPEKGSEWFEKWEEGGGLGKFNQSFLLKVLRGKEKNGKDSHGTKKNPVPTPWSHSLKKTKKEVTLVSK